MPMRNSCIYAHFSARSVNCLALIANFATFVMAEERTKRKRDSTDCIQVVIWTKSMHTINNNNANTSNNIELISVTPLFCVSISKSANWIGFKYGNEIAFFGYRSNHWCKCEEKKKLIKMGTLHSHHNHSIHLRTAVHIWSERVLQTTPFVWMPLCMEYH